MHILLCTCVYTYTHTYAILTYAHMYVFLRTMFVPLRKALSYPPGTDCINTHTYIHTYIHKYVCTSANGCELFPWILR